MKSRINLTRIVFALVLALSAFGISTTAALADQPVMYQVGPITDGTTLYGVCDFPVVLSSTFSIDGTDFLNKEGVVTRTLWHFVAQDTLSANGKTLTGTPYRYMIEVLWDSAGNPTGWFANGVVEKVQLPKGLYNPAGRVDLSDNPFGFTLSPDYGNQGNLTGLCAELAP